MQYFPLAFFTKNLIVVTIKTVPATENSEEYEEVFFSDYSEKLETFSFKRGDRDKNKLSYYKADSKIDLDTYNLSIAPLSEWHPKTKRKNATSNPVPTQS